MAGKFKEEVDVEGIGEELGEKVRPCRRDKRYRRDRK